MSKFQAPRGTHDVLPRDHLWWRVIRTIEEQCAQYGWSRVSTPGFEETALFERTAGEASDVVHKEMYSFEDRGDRSLTLRPEGTAPIARAYVEHGLAQEPQPVKAYAIAPMYRYSRPGRGRYREHWQLSLEAIGSADPAIDAEVIQFYAELLRRLGVTEWELRLNSIGDANCRPQYVARLNEWLDAHPELVDEEVAHKRATSVLQVFDVKNEKVLAALADAPKIGDSLCDACREHFDAVKAYLDALRRPVRARPGARARPRLLHAHDLRVRRARGERQLDDLRRRPLRRPRRGGRRAGDARHRLRRRARAAPARDGAGGRDRRGAAARPLRRLRGAGAARAAPPADRRSGGRRAARSTPTTLAAR